MAHYGCPDCRGRLLSIGARSYECEDCGETIEEAGVVEQAADMVREFDDLDRLAEWLDENAERIREETADV